MKNMMVIKKVLFLICLLGILNYYNKCITNVNGEEDEDIYSNNRENDIFRNNNNNSEEMDTTEEDKEGINEDEVERTDEETDFRKKNKYDDTYKEGEDNMNINDDKEEDDTEKKKKRVFITFNKLFNNYKAHEEGEGEGGCKGGLCLFNTNNKKKNCGCPLGSCPLLNNNKKNVDDLLSSLSPLLELLENEFINLENNNDNIDVTLASMLNDPLMASLFNNNNNGFFNNNNNYNPFNSNNYNPFLNNNNFSPFFNNNNNNPFFNNNNNNPFFNNNNNNPFFNNNNNPFFNNNNNPFFNNNNPFFNNNNPFFNNNNNNPIMNNNYLSQLLSQNNPFSNLMSQNNPADLFSQLFSSFNDFTSPSAQPFRQQYENNEVHVTHPNDDVCLFLIKWDEKILLDHVNVNVDTTNKVLIVKYNYTFVAGTTSQSSTSLLKESINKKCDASENAVMSKKASYILSNDKSGGSTLEVWFPHKPADATVDEEDKEENEEEYIENTRRQVAEDGFSEFYENESTTKSTNYKADGLNRQNQKNENNIPPKKIDNQSHIKILEEDLKDYD